MRFISILFLLSVSAQGFAQSQLQVDQFLKEHSPVSSKIFCESDKKSPHCRTLVRFANNNTGEIVDAFQIAFFAPSRPFAATEIFIPSQEQPGLYNNYIDNTMNGDFTVSDTNAYKVIKENDSITILNLPFGTMSFLEDEVVLTLKNGDQVVYDLFQPLQ